MRQVHATICSAIALWVVVFIGSLFFISIVFGSLMAIPPDYNRIVQIGSIMGGLVGLLLGITKALTRQQPDNNESEND